MSKPLAPWLLEPWQRLLDARRAQRLPHGLLFCGPAGLGQLELAEQFAAALLCTTPVDGAACGSCRGCRLRIAETHPDLRRVSLLERDDGKLKSEIGVDQMRELGPWFSLTPQLGGAQVALIAPADRLNVAAANALLKTLEEPASNRFLILVGDRPERLPATVRSRCQRVEPRLPTLAVALRWMVAQGVDAEAAESALRAAQGHPGDALQMLQSGGLKQRAAVLADLNALLGRGATPAEVAQRWLADDAAQCLRHAVTLVHEHGRASAAGRSSGLTAPVDFNKLAAWSQRANRARDQLAAPLRHELLLTGLLQDWRAIGVARRA